MLVVVGNELLDELACSVTVNNTVWSLRSCSLIVLDSGLWQEMQHPWVEIKGALCSFGEETQIL